HYPPHSPHSHTLFPYTTLFRSHGGPEHQPENEGVRLPVVQAAERQRQREQKDAGERGVRTRPPGPRGKPGEVHGRAEHPPRQPADRKSTRLNSSHVSISYAVFC